LEIDEIDDEPFEHKITGNIMSVDISGMEAEDMELFVKHYRLKDDIEYMLLNPRLKHEAEMAPHSIEVQNFAIITSLFFKKLPSAVKTDIWTHVVSSRDYVHNKMVSHRVTKSVDQITRILSHFGILFDVYKQGEASNASMQEMYPYANPCAEWIGQHYGMLRRDEFIQDEKYLLKVFCTKEDYVPSEKKKT